MTKPEDLPIVHLNGTSKEELIEQRVVAFNALQDAYQALKEMAPNGRDYYPDPGRMERARALHESRQRRIQDLVLEIEEEIGQIDELGK